jgi:hypothetical protein
MGIVLIFVVAAVVILAFMNKRGEARFSSGRARVAATAKVPPGIISRRRRLLLVV